MKKDEQRDAHLERDRAARSTIGDEVMSKVLRDAQYYLGLLAGNLANVLDPEVIVIGGGIAERLGERFVAPIREHAYKHFLVQRDRERVRIVPPS